MSCQLHAPAALPRERAPGTHWIGGWVDVGMLEVESSNFIMLKRRSASLAHDSAPSFRASVECSSLGSNTMQHPRHLTIINILV
jgi:hypothetical protein